MKMRVTLFTLGLVLGIGLSEQSFAQSQKFTCGGLGGASSIGRVDLTVNTSRQMIGTEVHLMGNAQIGRVADSLFIVYWDSTTHMVFVHRQDSDGFLAAAIGSDKDSVLLRVNRPGHDRQELQVACEATH
jgi:hypothetical protein